MLCYVFLLYAGDLQCAIPGVQVRAHLVRAAAAAAPFVNSGRTGNPALLHLSVLLLAGTCYQLVYVGLTHY